MVDDLRCAYCGSLALTRRRVSGHAPLFNVALSFPYLSLKYERNDDVDEEKPVQYTCSHCGYSYIFVFDRGSEGLLNLLESVQTFLNTVQSDPEKEARRQNILANFDEYGISLDDVFAGVQCAVHVLRNRASGALDKALSQFRRHGGVVLDVIFLANGEKYILRIVRYVSDNGALIYEPKGVFPFVGGGSE